MSRRVSYLQLVEPEHPQSDLVRAARSAVADATPDDEPIRGMQALAFGMLWCVACIAVLIWLAVR